MDQGPGTTGGPGTPAPDGDPDHGRGASHGSSHGSSHGPPDRRATDWRNWASDGPTPSDGDPDDRRGETGRGSRLGEAWGEAFRIREAIERGPTDGRQGPTVWVAPPGWRAPTGYDVERREADRGAGTPGGYFEAPRGSWSPVGDGTSERVRWETSRDGTAWIGAPDREWAPDAGPSDLDGWTPIGHTTDGPSASYTWGAPAPDRTPELDRRREAQHRAPEPVAPVPGPSELEPPEHRPSEHGTAEHGRSEPAAELEPSGRGRHRAPQQVAAAVPWSASGLRTWWLGWYRWATSRLDQPAPTEPHQPPDRYGSGPGTARRPDLRWGNGRRTSAGWRLVAGPPGKADRYFDDSTGQRWHIRRTWTRRAAEPLVSVAFTVGRRVAGPAVVAGWSARARYRHYRRRWIASFGDPVGLATADPESTPVQWPAVAPQWVRSYRWPAHVVRPSFVWARNHPTVFRWAPRWWATGIDRWEWLRFWWWASWDRRGSIPGLVWMVATGLPARGAWRQWINNPAQDWHGAAIRGSYPRHRLYRSPGSDHATVDVDPVASGWSWWDLVASGGSTDHYPAASSGDGHVPSADPSSDPAPSAGGGGRASAGPSNATVGTHAGGATDHRR